MKGKGRVIVAVIFAVGAALYYGGSALLDLLENGEIPHPPGKGKGKGKGKSKKRKKPSDNK